jgi:tetratricopeptide (TPR) repeat protein
LDSRFEYGAGKAALGTIARMPVGDGYDLFLSCAGPDRVAARALRRALEKEGQRVFLDERSIGIFDSITQDIEDALRSSRALLAYYSEHYSSRPACQQELTAAFLAGQREGDPMRRIVVLNPEDPQTEHLLPSELADRRYPPLRLPVSTPVSERDFRETARQIRARIKPLAGTIGGVGLAVDRRWFGRSAGSVGFAGRYREQWQIHTALRDIDFPLSRSATAAPAVTVVGMPGMGKTALAAAYAWNFGAAYARGTVCWLNLAGAGASDEAVLARYDDAVRTLAEQLDLRTGDAARHEVLGRVAAHLHGLAEPSLWVVDDVPVGLDPATVRRLLFPGSTKVRTILTCHQDQYRAVAPSVLLGPMPDADVAAMLEHFRRPGAGERDSFERLVPKLRGHPLVVQLAGNALQDRRDLVSYDDYAALLAEDHGSIAGVANVLRPVLQKVSEPARLVLRLARACAPSGLPARFVKLVVDRIRGPGLVADALVELKTLALASVDGTSWRVHQLVLDAARDVESPSPQPVLLEAAATALEQLADDSGLSPTDMSDLMRHAGALAGAPDMASAAAIRLLRRATAYYERRGEPALAAPSHDQLVDLDPTPDAFAAAAATSLAAGDYDTAAAYATHAVDSGDSAAAYRGRRTRAEALEAQGRYDTAERDWQVLRTAPAPADDPIERLRTDVSRLRSLRLRGRMTEVKATAPDVIAGADGLAEDHPVAFDLARAAELDLARAEVLTDGQRDARQRAESVIRAYQARGLPDHARALEAQEVLAEARLTMHLWELNPDKDHWLRAEVELRDLREQYARTYGRTNPLTLAAGVDYSYALVSQGRRKHGCEELEALLPALERTLGTEHPLYYRALFLRGLIHAQRQDPRTARPLLQRALTGQKVTLGLGHAHTLRTQYELAVVLKLEDDPGWRPLMQEVHDRARAATGRENDLYAQSLIALGLLRLPGSLVRAVAWFGRPGGHAEDC